MRAFRAQDDVAVAALAREQYGLVTHAQLVELGFGRGMVARRVAAGRLHRVHRGVYAVGHAAARDEARWLAAVLACGEGALLSHHSAAALWGFRARDHGPPHIVVDGRGGRRQQMIVVHRTRIDEEDRALCRGIPVTSPERTLADLTRLLATQELTRAVREAEYLELIDFHRLDAVLRRRPARLLRSLTDDLRPTQSRMEDELLRICRRHRLPAPLTQQPLLRGRVDFLWPDVRLVVQVDGWRGHRGRMAFQADRTETNALQLAGYTVLRFTWADLTRRPKEVAHHIRAALRSPLHRSADPRP